MPWPLPLFMPRELIALQASFQNTPNMSTDRMRTGREKCVNILNNNPLN